MSKLFEVFIVIEMNVVIFVLVVFVFRFYPQSYTNGNTAFKRKVDAKQLLSQILRFETFCFILIPISDLMFFAVYLLL